MRKVFLFLAPLILAIIVLSVFIFFMNRSSGKGALQVTAIPKSDVYIDGKLIGQTPLCRCEGEDMLEEGEHNIKIAPMGGNLATFEDKITINKSVLTVVDRTFSDTTTEGSIITLFPIDDKKLAQMLVVSFPDKANVYLDSNSSGITPLFLKDITDSDHELKLTKDGYKDKIIRIKAVKGYKLSLTAFLGISPILDISPSPIASPTPTITSLRIRILETPTGFLRVREEPSISSKEVGRVSPGQTFEVLEEDSQWFKIEIEKDVFGWVSSQYTEKEEN